MFNPDQAQWKVIWLTIGAAFVFWLFGQASDYDEGFWYGIAVFALVVGAMRVWMLEGRKTNQPR